MICSTVTISMRVNIKRIDNDFLMEAVNDTGNTIVMDGSESIGGRNAGMRPMQLLLTAVGGCSAIDMISILKKQRQAIQDFSVQVDGDKVKVDDHSVYKNITITFTINGAIDPEKALKAAELSFGKYCSVSKALEFSSDIAYSIVLNGTTIR